MANESKLYSIDDIRQMWNAGRRSMEQQLRFNVGISFEECLKEVKITDSETTEAEFETIKNEEIEDVRCAQIEPEEPEQVEQIETN